MRNHIARFHPNQEENQPAEVAAKQRTIEQMSKKSPRCTAADLSALMTSTQSQVDCSANLVAERRTEANSNHSTSSSPESGSLNGNGNGKRNGKRRRSKKRSSKIESDPEGKVDSKDKNEETSDMTTSQPPNCRAGLIGLQSECASVWFERGIYEQAESLNQCWLANSSKRTTKLNGSTSTPEKKGPRPGKKKAEHQIEEPVQPTDSVELSSKMSITSRTLSQAPTPSSNVIQQRAVTATTHQSVNGLSPVLAELFRNVWLEKPQYDRAEATFYQNLYGNNSSKRSSCTSTPRSSEHPQSLVEEEEEVAVEEKRVVSQAKAEVFHALHPIQEEEEPVEVPDKDERQDLGACYFLHPDSEQVWLDKWRFDAAESRYHVREAAAAKKGWSSKSTDSTVCLTENNMSTVNFLVQEKIWYDKTRYDEAERRFFERVNSASHTAQAVCDAGANTILQDIARARENIQKSLAGNACSSNTSDQELVSRIKNLELENQSLHKVVHDLRAALFKLESRVAVLEKSPVAVAAAPSVPYTNGTTIQQKISAPAKEEADDDDLDLFGSDDDDNEEAEKLKEQRLKEYAERKAKKPAVVAKSSILLDVKPWDDETDMAKLEECVRSVQADGLLWGVSKLVPVGYGIKKLQISCVVEDDKVGTDLLEEEITRFEDYVQSVDVAAFNKI
ncbi:eukaryotic translation elongation factor 1 delta b (guanine nucleotide exchange protein) isoform X2 [Dunckerocampus dactyliophorus]|uniref:eukaryotic translation elongation factor 1 delta b (guanine nucleotide exchange protein) isoform X2 n=1 Tax=Dunckerocampus dactyliophorus TaxID=161453 RepID=UPI002405D208|nr:eukaryotic translation elongation factor 1 delta b (guanine nucleotide exchange protein) isoform X2 [Dunckerocampus dactyliophorus]